MKSKRINQRDGKNKKKKEMAKPKVKGKINMIKKHGDGSFASQPPRYVFVFYKQVNVFIDFMYKIQ